MDDKRKDDIYYVCTMIEFVGRATNNHRKDVVKRLSKKSIEHQLKVAEVNHCLSFEQVCDEWIQQLVIETAEKNEEAQAIIDVFSSFISDEISNFNSDVYYSNPDYLRCSYEAGFLLA